MFLPKVNLTAVFQAKSIAALESKSFRTYLAGQGISSLGTGLQQVALAWLVYKSTHSAWALAAYTAVILCGQFLFSFLGGCLADKFERRKLLMILQCFGATISLLVVLSVLLNIFNLYLIFLLAFSLGVYVALEYPVRQSFSADLVSDENLVSARGLYSCTCSASIAAGQACGGLLIDILPAYGEALCSLLNAASFVFSFMLLNVIASGNNAHFEKNAGSMIPLNNRECLKIVRESELILLTFVQTAVLVLFGTRFCSLLPAFAAESFNGGAREAGVLTATLALGFSLGAIICGAARKRERLEVLADLSLLFLPMAVLVFCLSDNFFVAIACVLLMSICQSVNINSCICLMQMSAPAKLFGRLMGLRITLVAICDLAASLLAVFSIRHFGLTVTVMTAAFFCFLAAILVFSRRALARTAGSLLAGSFVYSRSKR